jgi:hypothetical protein
MFARGHWTPLQPADSAFANTAVLSYGAWVSVFGSDRSVADARFAR